MPEVVKQINVSLPMPLAMRIKADAAAMGVQMGEYARIAFEDFIANNKSARETRLKRAKKKVMGRPTETTAKCS